MVSGAYFLSSQLVAHKVGGTMNANATLSVISDCLLSELGWMAVLLPIPRQLGLGEQVRVARDRLRFTI